MRWIKIIDDHEISTEHIFDIDSAIYFNKDTGDIGFPGFDRRVIFRHSDNKDYQFLVEYFENKVKELNAKIH